MITSCGSSLHGALGKPSIQHLKLETELQITFVLD